LFSVSRAGQSAPLPEPVRRCILTLARFCTDYNRRFACAPHDEAEAA